MPDLARRFSLFVAACTLTLGTGQATGRAAIQDGNAEAKPVEQENQNELKVGHWVEVKGKLEEGFFYASSIEVIEPEDKEILIGTVHDVDLENDRFHVLGQPVTTSQKTTWRELGMRSLEGRQVKVDGHYRGPGKFSSRTVAQRGDGRDRIVGRIDSIELVGGDIELRIMRWRIVIPDALEVESEQPLEGIALAPARQVNEVDTRFRDEEDVIPGTIRITDELYLGAQLEHKIEREENYDLDDDRNRDRTDWRLNLRTEFNWRPRDDFLGLVRWTSQYDESIRENDKNQEDWDVTLNEAWGFWQDPFGMGLDLLVGRQDFDEPREWLYDQNLDGVRLIWNRPSLRVEASASTVFSEGNDRDKHTDNYILYVSNNDNRKHLAGYVIDRRDDRSQRDYPVHMGGRILGEWIPENDVWAELSFLRGHVDDENMDSYGFDVGTTWSPEAADPWHFTIGYAFGSGDPDPSSGDNETFQQTGLNDNNDKLGGVTSFRYYGEVFEPELSNMSIWTVGVGRRIGRKSSLVLVLHKYDQDQAIDELFDSNLRPDPNGLDEDLGWGADLVFGSRALEGWDFEVIVGAFLPGDAFDDDDPAYLASFQVRYRF